MNFGFEWAEFGFEEAGLSNGDGRTYLMVARPQRWHGDDWYLCSIPY